MNFIFPKNYNFKNKLFGVIDYTTAIFNLILFLILFFIINSIFNNVTIKIFIIILFYFPIFLFSIIGSNNENILYTIFYLVKF